MKLDIFLKLYDQKKKAMLHDEYLKERIKSIYLPIEKKQKLAEDIVSISFWKDVDGCRELHIDSVKKYIATCVAIFSEYSDVEISYEKDLVENFNKLNMRGLFDSMIHVIDQRELKELNMVIQMVTDDFMTNELNHNNV